MFLWQSSWHFFQRYYSDKNYCEPGSSAVIGHSLRRTLVLTNSLQQLVMPISNVAGAAVRAQSHTAVQIRVTQGTMPLEVKLVQKISRPKESGFIGSVLALAGEQQFRHKNKQQAHGH